ncbi:methylated-DNA--[protein]-cysteine S-methyltransferase [Carboxylicivirga sp. M1479]|uniref:methylated-DNA--[protein]-cysteine S-methyltransferase n=1 Tax=Carboxylicivirga sp. M1479 TaxID=2594476 RepID=UPI0011779521|nr:methylated-DNA--[protein]-cysteine S-methyltransferase [Carboxylicivirga sp. M1479]TRX61677.1 methylated-DNA--[protein]-cysteine S-methyltransferase [Carboxylicivirga sp. M1479]
MPHITTQYYRSPFGELILGSYQEQLCLCDWRFRKMRESIDKRICKGLNTTYKKGNSAVIEQTIKQLEAYSQKELKEFELPILFIGSDFQKTVWNELLKVQYGHTQTYLQLSKQLNNTKAIRAVASANGANAISIIVPCHRIIGSNGKLIGYAGGLQAKKKLLELENQQTNSQLSLF